MQGQVLGFVLKVSSLLQNTARAQICRGKNAFMARPSRIPDARGAILDPLCSSLCYVLSSRPACLVRLSVANYILFRAPSSSTILNRIVLLRTYPLLPPPVTLRSSYTIGVVPTTTDPAISMTIPRPP